MKPQKIPRTLVLSLGVVVVLISVLLNLLPDMIREKYREQGIGDQFPVFVIVLASFISPAFAPFLQVKHMVSAYMLPTLGLQHVETEWTYILGRKLLTPSVPFNETETTVDIDYSNLRYWSMFPGRDGDSGSTVPPGCDVCPANSYYDCLIADTFYLHPTTWYTSLSWNSPIDHPVSVYLSDDAIGPQQAVAFNIASRIFAPRFRQMCAAGFLQEDSVFKHPDARKALDLAYKDAKAAFQYYLDHHNQGRPIIIAGHSQGSLLGERLIQDFFQNKSLSNQLVAAYLPGWTVFDGAYRHGSVHVCRDGTDTSCVISWRTFGRGGDDRAFLHVEPKPSDGKPICHNPLSWKWNGKHVPHDKNSGGLDLMHPRTMFNYLFGNATDKPGERIVQPKIRPNLVDAHCENGSLWISPLSHYGYGWLHMPAWTFANFPGMSSHAYDINLYFNNIRQNVKERVDAWVSAANLKEKTKGNSRME